MLEKTYNVDTSSDKTMAASTTTLLLNGKVFQSSGQEKGKDQEATFSNCMLIKDGVIEHVGSEDDSLIVSAKKDGAVVQDLAGRTVLPGFIDGHMHVLIMGQSILKVGLEHCKNLEDIRSAIREYAKTNTTVPRISCRGWMHSMTPDGVNYAMLDDLDPLGRPIFVDTKDLHSTWCSTAAIKELDIQTTPDPVGGKIHRDADGNPTGLLEEAGVFTIVWPHIARVASLEERAAAIRSAVEAYNTVGYTGLVDMAMDEDIWEALQKLITDYPDVPMRFAAYWLIKPSTSEADHLKQVDRAAELAAQFNATNSPGCRVVGIKIICDGIIDSCTASLKEPYSSNGASTDAIWTKPQLLPVVRKADSLGLQVALHAIGDATIKMAIDVIEECVTPNRRPRIEHLELSSPEDAARLGRLGITASIQPVHSDPAILRAWPRLIGEHRCGRAFAYREFADGGSPLALGSDAPTAPHAPLANIYVATTRRSARESGPEGPAAFNEHFALGLCESVVAGTKGAAYSTFADSWSGGLLAGMKADFVVCDMQWEKEKLLAAKVAETWFDGRKVYGA